MKTHTLLALVAIVALTSPVVAQCGLTTGFAGGNGFAGNWFDAVALNPAGVQITGFDINLDPGTSLVEVWYVTGGGSYVGLETTMASWTLAGSGMVTSNGSDVPTPLNFAFTLPLIPMGATQGLYVVVNGTGGVDYSNGTTEGAVLVADSNLQILEGKGGGYFTSLNTPRNINANIYYTYPGQVLDWQVNSPALSVDINGVQASPCAKATVTLPLYACSPPIPASGTFNLSSNEVGEVYDVVLTSLPLLPATAGGVILPDGQLFNLDLFGGPYTWLSSGGPTPNVTTIPAGFPGSNTTNLSVAFSLGSSSFTSLQGVVFSPSSMLGYVLSQATELSVPSLAPPASVAGPTTTTGVITYDVTGTPTCWCASGIPFFGQMFTQMHVSPNGFVHFGGTDTDTTPSVLDAMADVGRVGFWTDLDPSEGGAITVSNPATDVIRVDWAGVFYNTGGPGISFGIQFNCQTGDIQIDGLGGIVANPGISTTDDQWLGISPGTSITGITTTDPDPTAFSLGGNGVAGVESDMLYEFNDTSVSLSGLPASITGGLTTLNFMPVPVGIGTNYTWFGT